MRNFSDNNVPKSNCRSATICGYTGVLAVLCVAKFGEGWAALPKDVLLHALGFCGRGWFISQHADNAAAIADDDDDEDEEEEEVV